MERYLQPTAFFDYDHPRLQAWIESELEGVPDEKVGPLEFDGVHDSMFQEYTEDGHAHMEYVNDHGLFDDVPHEFIVSGVRAAYSHLFAEEEEPEAPKGSLVQDISSP